MSVWPLTGLMGPGSGKLLSEYSCMPMAVVRPVRRGTAAGPSGWKPSTASSDVSAAIGASGEVAASLGRVGSFLLL